MGDLSVKVDRGERFWLTGSYTSRIGTCAGSVSSQWFGGSMRKHTRIRMGFLVSGPARAVLDSWRGRRTTSRRARAHFLCRTETGRGLGRAVVGRISITGEIGYEIVAHRAASHAACESCRRPAPSRASLDRRPAAESLRLDEGLWDLVGCVPSGCTPGQSGLDRTSRSTRAPSSGVMPPYANTHAARSALVLLDAMLSMPTRRPTRDLDGRRRVG